jgi:hypothetical protein
VYDRLATLEKNNDWHTDRHYVELKKGSGEDTLTAEAI